MTRVTHKESSVGRLVQTADGSWTVEHPSHGQTFHSLEGARFEASSLYVVASGLGERLCREPKGDSNLLNLSVLDVGMGLGYNACATISAWLNSPGSISLKLISLEIDLALVERLSSGLAPWCAGWKDTWLAGPKVLRRVEAKSAVWQAELVHPNSAAHVLKWFVLVGDAKLVRIEEWGPFDYFWQDPFTPELNPTLWDSAWFAHLRKVTRPSSLLMTYSVARGVRDALQAGGWIPERFATPGKKRHWLRATPVH